MNILIRCDSSNIIGTGHVMRCLNYCDYFDDCTFTFICRDFNMNISSKITENRHNLILLDYDIEPEINNYRSWIGKEYNDEINEITYILSKSKNIYDKIIIDHYGIDYILEKKIKEIYNNIEVIVISDIFEHNHWCNTFINYNCDDLLKVTNINLNPNTIYKIGVENIIINKKFRNGIKKIKFKDKIENIVINMGGADPLNYILKVLKIINEYILNNNIIVHVIIGKSNNNIESIQEFINNNDNDNSEKSNYFIYYDINYDTLINLYINSDLAIGSLSITAYERLFLNIPQICLKIVDNQLIQQLKEFNIIYIDNLLDKIKSINKIE